MASPARFPDLLTRLALLMAYFCQVNCSPIRNRAFDPFTSTDPSSDAWADTLSGISPLILLVGERVTKQLLRSIRGATDAFSLAAAPLGLLSVVTSLIRCCGIEFLRAFIGCELEARAVAAIEMTRVNCGGVHAEIVDGYIVRSAAANPASQAIAVSLLQGSMRELKDEALLQIRSCKAFNDEMAIKDVPDSVAALQWTLHIISAGKSHEFSVIKTLVQAVNSDLAVSVEDDETRAFCQSFMRSSKDMTQNSYAEVVEIAPVIYGVDESTGFKSTIEAYHDPSARGGVKKQYEMNVLEREATSESLKDTLHGGIYAETSGLSNITQRQTKDSSAQMPRLAFMFTLSAVSEFATTSPNPKPVSILLGLISFLAILAIYMFALWQNQWQFSVGLLLVLIGYIGIVLSVMLAALIIHSSCACIKLDNRSTSNPKIWTDGLVVSVKNTDSMDTRGSELMRSRYGTQHFEVVWMRDLRQQVKILASGTAIALVVFFICHYLGLRSSYWWVSVAELLVCVLAAVARSFIKDHQEKFSLDDQVRIDKRCTSTGIIQTQQCQVIEKRSRNPEIMDSRAYSTISLGQVPVSGERIAWYIAQLCIQDETVASKVLELTGMRVHVKGVVQQTDNCTILVSYTGGLLVTEGLASPNVRLCLAFKTKISDLALPTALLARAIMRQPEWFIDDVEICKGIPLGNVYVFSITSIIDWWSISEDRNDFSDLQKNLQWCFVLINAAFFISLLRLRELEELGIDSIEEAHSELSESNQAVAQKVVRFFQEGGSGR
jgi:hypothetical protein